MTAFFRNNGAILEKMHKSNGQIFNDLCMDRGCCRFYNEP